MNASTTNPQICACESSPRWYLPLPYDTTPTLADEPRPLALLRGARDLVAALHAMGLTSTRITAQHDDPCERIHLEIRPGAVVQLRRMYGYDFVYGSVGVPARWDAEIRRVAAAVFSREDAR